MLRFRRSRKSGFVAVMATLGVLVLLGAAALTIDIGRISISAQRAQFVADAAALAGAQGLPDQGAANTRINSIVNANNASVSWPQVGVDTGTDVTFYAAGSTVPGYGELENDEQAVEVTTHVTELNCFVGLLGEERMNVTRTSTAKVEVGNGSLPSIFCGDDRSWMYGLIVNGSHQNFQGDIHSNTQVVINGSHQTVTGPLEYRHRLVVNGAHQDFQGGTMEGPNLGYPVDWAWEDFDDWDQEVSNIWVNGAWQEMEFGHTHVTGNVVLNGAHFYGHDGILMVEGNVTVNGAHHTFENVTIIAKGSITFNGAAQKITPYVDGLSLMSLSSYYYNAITYNGAHQTANSTLYAPNGGITYNGSHQEVQDGSIIAKHLTINGSHFDLHGTDISGTGEKVVQLIR